MDAHQHGVNWHDQSNEILLNPRWPKEDLGFLRQTAIRVLEERGLKSYLVLSSSGTTAASWRQVKLYFLAKTAVLASARSVAQTFGFWSSDLFAQSLPMFHVGGLGVAARALVCGGKVVPFAPRWDPREFVTQLRDHKISVASVVPTQLHDLVAGSQKAPADLKCCFVGGAALTPRLEEKARILGWPLIATYGMTETAAMIATRSDPNPARGLEILPHIEVSLDPHSRLRVRGSSLASLVCYPGDHPRTESVTDAEGWFTTEDRALLTEGRLQVLGRAQDQVKISGELVQLSVLREIWEEEVLRQDQDPKDFHLFVISDERLGSKLVLASVRSTSSERLADLPHLIDAFHQRVLPFERIRETVVVDRIPRGELGKVREEELRQLVRPG